MNTPWRIEMLGWLCARQGDLTLTRFRTQKTALLLARLALFPQRTHPREELADLLWPEADLEAGRNNLKQSLAVLRRQVEPPGTASGSVLIADRQNVRLNPAAFSTDVTEFEAALRAENWEHAAALYRGELLPGFYDDWVVEERERLTALWEGVPLSRDTSAPSRLPSALLPPSLPPVAIARPALPLPTLPLFFTRFFGREAERTEMAALLSDPHTRLLTLTGPGGTGKTRLAVEIARQVAAEWENRVYFVPLADLSDLSDLADPVLLPATVADTLRAAPAAASDPWEQIAAVFGEAPALLVLDNLEQIASGAAAFVLALLTRFPGLTVLATSRTRLSVANEREYPLRPLEMPGADDSPERLQQFPGIRLFADRAQAARPDFQITPRNAAAVAAVCRRLEGIPLALELAAAWASLLTPAQMQDRLEDRFSLLVSRRKDRAERHQTLWSAMAWSYDLLPPPLARFWARLSVFRGGFTADAAQEVCEESSALEGLGRLGARSLVVTEADGPEMRFRLLETLREFGAAQLSGDETAALMHRHAAYFLGLAEKAEPELTGPEQGQWLNRLAAEQDNLRAALEWDAAPAGDAERGLRLAGSLWRFWSVRGPLSEGRRRLTQALARFPGGDSSGTAAQARALNGLAVLTRRAGDMAEAGALQRRCLALWRALGDTRGIASSLNNLGTLATLQGEYAEAEPLLRESLALWRELGQTVTVAQTLNNLGFLAEEREEYGAAQMLCRESLALFRAAGDTRGVTLSLSVLAMAAAELGDYAEAHSLCAEVFAVAGEMQDAQTVVGGLAVLGQAAVAQNRPRRAARLLGAAQALRDQFGSYQDTRAQARAHRAVAEARQALPAADFEAAWAEGQAMTAEAAVAFALREPDSA